MLKKILPFLIIILLLIVIRNNISSISSTLNNNNSETTLAKRLSEEKKKNQYLKEKLSYVKTEEFIEEEAQDKLGLLRKGEYFVIAPTPAPLNSEEFVIDDRPNWQKWVELFF